MKEIEFKRLTFRSGLNLTFRKGDKWLDVTGIHRAFDQSGRGARVRVVGTLYIPEFKNLIGAEDFLTLVNDPQARVYSKLHQLMRQAYPGRPQFHDEPAFSQTEPVTAVFFQVIDKGNAIPQVVKENEEE